MNNNYGKNAFNLFISIGSYPLKLDYPLFAINIDIPLSKKEFYCLFGQTWNVSPYMWIYDKDILLCNLRKFWKKNNTMAAHQFYEQFNSLQLKNIESSYSLIEKEFTSPDGILYKYFHEYNNSQITEQGYKQISYYLDDLIDRKCYNKQLFYYSKCTQTFPNLIDDSHITLYGRFIIHNIPFNVSLNYYIHS